MAPVVYHAKIVSPVRQAVGIIAGLGGMLAILYLGAPFIIDERGDFRPVGTLGLLAVSCVWGLLAVLSQSANAHWSISNEEVHERIAPRLAWLPFGMHGERRIRTIDVKALRVGRAGMGSEQRPVIVLDVRGQPPLNIYSKRRKADPKFTEIAGVLERALGRPEQVDQPGGG